MQKQRNSEKPTRRRVDPVSCALCRQKKLKCNRQAPCSNCIARGVACEGQKDALRNVAQTKPPVDTDAILARLQKLEEIVLRRGDDVSTTTAGTDYQLRTPPAPSPQAISEKDSFQQDMDSLDANMVSFENLRDSEAMGIDQPDEPAVKIRPIAEIATGPALKAKGTVRTVWLPKKEEALELLGHYRDYANHLHHIIHLPLAFKLLHGFYDQLNETGRCNNSHVVLILAMFASTSFIWGPDSSYGDIFRSPSEAMLCCKFWARTTIEMSERLSSTGSASMEEIQAIVVISFLLYNLEGFTKRATAFYIRGMTMARTLRFHTIDTKREELRRRREGEDPIQTEMKRRVWWHIVATDWSIALIPGPYEGIYTLHPNQMKVNLPRNVNDEDLLNKPPDFTRPMSEPTTASYFLQRVRLGQLSRMVVDAIPVTIPDPTEVDYQIVVSLDEKFEEFQNQLPPFFQHWPMNLKFSGNTRPPYIVIQSYVVGLTSCTRRLKLHQPFLIRAKMDQRYKFSRDVAVQCARRTIALCLALEQNQNAFLSADPKFCFVLHHVFWASAILVMELCYNKATNDGEDERRVELKNACTMLEAAKERSHMAKKFLSSLLSVLRKHNVRLLEDLPTRSAIDALPTPEESQLPYTVGNPWSESSNAKSKEEGVMLDAQVLPDPDFSTVWSDYIEYGDNMDIYDWDKLMMDIEAESAW